MKIGTLQTVAITLIIIGIVFGVGLLILTEFLETTGEDTTTVFNETLSAVSTTDVYVANNVSTADVFCYNNFLPIIVTNATGGEAIPTTNYTYVAPLGTIRVVDSTSQYDGSAWNITYSYMHDLDNSTMCTGVTDTVEATTTVGTWLTIIVLMLIVGIILYMVLKFVPEFAKGGTGAEGTIAEV